METLGHFWYAAVRSGFARVRDWRDWADRRIETSDHPEYWVIEMAMASTVDKLMQSLDERMCFERELNNWYGIRTGDACLGYFFWSYKLERLAFAEFLLKAGRMADETDGVLIEPEGPYMILNELNRRLECRTTIDDLVARTDNLFEDCWRISKSQWQILGLDEPSS